jgi:hypothetical protein
LSKKITASKAQGGGCSITLKNQITNSKSQLQKAGNWNLKIGI